MLFTSRDLDSSTVSWVSDPDGRGTFSLITSCVLTMGLCVWTALHLNLPPPTFSRKRWWLESVRWALTGIFAPELIVFVAWRQYISARVLQDIVKECAHNSVIENTNNGKPRNTSVRQFRWRRPKLPALTRILVRHVAQFIATARSGHTMDYGTWLLCGNGWLCL